MIQPKSLFKFSQILSQENSPILLWYPIWKYLSNWPESDEREQAVILATTYFEQQGETLNLWAALTPSESKERCKSLVFFAEQLREEELKCWYPDLLAAYTFYQEDIPDEKLVENSDIGLHNKLENLLKKCVSTKLIETAQFIYSERCNAEEYASSNPWNLHEDDYWMEEYFLEFFPEIDIDALSLAALIWTDGKLAGFCLERTNLTLIEICRPLLIIENGRGILSLSGYAGSEQMPIGLGQFKNLQILTLSLEGINYLSADIGQLKDLESLYISMGKLECLPAEIGDLSNLKELTLENMYNLKDVPINFSQLSSLEKINL